ncbi:MAG: DUF2851 family protein [Flavobacteriaceae bacterium]|nr:DUF2851 family protein [Flavobacteriaceae bacterium]
MNEKVLHFIWKYQLFSGKQLETSQKELVAINIAGLPNENAGPDFTNASIKIGNQLWVGNIEIHLKSSDWYLHNHHVDDNYKSVILHVVWEYDREVYNHSQQIIPTLELSKFINLDFLKKYSEFNLSNPKWILCENELKNISKFTLHNYLDVLFLERLERKNIEIDNYLKDTKNDWEAVLFILLCKNFGVKINSEAFFQLAQSVAYQIIRKERNNLFTLEALFYGQAGFLNEIIEDAYYIKLQKEYQYLQNKYKLQSISSSVFHFFRLRPLNFPTIRMAQLSGLIYQHKSLFSVLLDCKTKVECYEIFKIQTSSYWNSHYTFQKESKFIKKTISKGFVDNLIINTIMPLKFAYYNKQKMDYNDSLMDLMKSLKPESNSIIKKFTDFGISSDNALVSQSLIQLKNEYCNYKRCLECRIGNEILRN